MDEELLELLNRLNELSIEEVDQLSEQIREAYRTMRDSGEVDLDLGAQYVEALGTISNRRSELVELQEQAAQELAALDAAVFGTEGTEGADGEGDTDPDADTDDSSDDDSSDDDSSDDEGDADGEGEGGDGAQLGTAQAPAAPRILRMPAVDSGRQASVPEDQTPQESNGEILDARGNPVSMDELPSVLDKAARSAVLLSESQLASTIDHEGATSKSLALKLTVGDAVPRVGRFGDFETSDEAFKALLDAKRQSRESDSRAVASGGACAPRRQEYAINVLGGDAEPVGDSLVSVTSDGKGTSFYRDIEFSDIVSTWIPTNGQDVGINSYTHAQDTSAANYPKGVAKAFCPTPATCDKEIREKAINFGNWMTWAFPELVAAIQKGGNAVFARHLEEKRLAAIYDYANTLSNVLVDTSQNLDASINVVDKLLRIVTADRRDNRLGVGDVRYIAYLPEWAKAQLQVGVIAMLDGIGDRLTVEQAVFEVLRRWNVDIVFYRDGFKAGTGTAGNLPTSIMAGVGTTIPLWQQQVRIGLVRDDAVYLDRGPTLDLGLVRTQDDIEQNNYTLFYETLEGICFKNKGVFVIDTLLCPNGAQAGSVTPTCAGVTSVVAS